MKPQRRKEILSDPDKAIRSLHSRLRADEIESLNQLSAQYRRLKDSIKEQQQQTKIISRQIGEAKRSNQPFEALKLSMQEHSGRIKQLNEALKSHEARLLAYFDQSNPDKPRKEESIAFSRRYPSAQIDISKVNISLLEDHTDDWNAYLARMPAASFYHRAEWKELIHQTFGHQGLYCVARDESQGTVGILPMIRLKSRLFGDFLVSMPYFNYGGPIADNPEIEDKLMTFANEKAAGMGISHIEYRDDRERRQYPARTDKVNMMLPLPSDPEVLFNAFSSKLRAQIKRPYREAPAIDVGGIELLDDFYEVFARNMRDLGTPVYPKSLFLNILTYFPDNCRIITVKLDGKPAAAGFLVNHGNMLEIPWASTIRRINHLSLNMLMYWEVLKFAITQGVDAFDFGRSSIDSGTYRFKKQWGAEPKQLYWHYWLNAGQEMPALNPANPKYTLLIALWKKMPLLLTKYIGPSIVKNLP